MFRRIAAYWPLWVNIGLLLLSTAILYRLSLARTQGHLIYPLDDAYMHLTLARNLAEHGVMGFTPTHFIFASSSPLYTLCLAAAFKIAGVHVSVPLLFNIVCGILLLSIVYFLFRKNGVPNWLAAGTLCLLIVLVPLPLLILSGMEHVMQVLFAVSCLGVIASLWDKIPAADSRLLAASLLAALATAARYESVFLLVTTCFLFALRRNFRASLFVGTGTVLGFTLPGIYSVSHGATFFPISVLLKRNMPAPNLAGLLTFGSLTAKTVSGNSYLVTLMIAVLVGCYFAQRTSGTFFNRYTATGMAWISACLLHISFARLGWVFRYEAYLIVGGCFLIAINPETARAIRFIFKPGLWVYPSAFALLFLLPFLNRTSAAWRVYPTAAVNIFEQQYQIADFLHRHYPSGRVALNDIGAVSFYSTAQIFDIFGLASPEVAAAKMANAFDSSRLSALSTEAGSQIAIAYEHWDFENPGGLPPEWQKIGSWTMPNNVVCGSDTVYFFAIDRAQARRLRMALADFRKQLPGEVVQTIRD